MKGKPLEEVDLVSIQNGRVKIGVDEATGFIRSMKWKGKKADIFEQTRYPVEGYIGGMRVFDEASRKWYDDFDGKFEVKWVNKGKDRTVSFVKQYKGAPFTVKVTMSLKKPYLTWDAELKQHKGKKGNRQVKVSMFLPIIAGWNVWAPVHNAPFAFDGMAGFDYYYNQTPYVGPSDMIVPVVSHYDAGLDVGYTVCDYFEKNVPSTVFQCSNAGMKFNWSRYFSVPNWEDYPYLEVLHAYIGMRGQKPCTTGMQVFFHEGDWRPGMGAVVERYRDFFYPPVDAIWDRTGIYTCGSVHTADTVEKDTSLGLKYLEVHGHFPYYGNYFYEERDEWESIGDFEAKAMGQMPADAKVPMLDREMISRKLKKLKENGVSCHWYLNFSDGFRQEVEKHWPKSIGYREDGEPAVSGWRFCHLMNPDPGGDFGRHILDNARKALDRYPELDGFFLDCFRHFELDFAHDDGVSMANNKPVYNISWGLGRMQEEIGALCRKRGKDCFANKPRTIWTMKEVEGNLLEGQGDNEEAKWFWTCVAKPIFYLWGKLDKPVEEYLKRCVILGGWPKLPEGKWREDEHEYRFYRELYDAYRPLYDQMLRRVVCFEPDPVKFSDGLYGQIYTRPDGAYLIAAMTDWTSVFDSKAKRVVAPYVAFRLKEGDGLGDVSVYYAGGTEPVQADYYRTGDGLVVVDMPDFWTAAVVVMKKGDGSRYLGVKKLRDTHEYCGDPTSAFELGSGAVE